MKLAVAGKGGVGKTTISGTLARLLARQGKAVLALDADSNPNLAISLGVEPDRAAAINPVPQELGQWREDAAGRACVHLTQPLGQVVQRFGLVAPDGVRLLVMGQVHRAGVGCRCSAHAAARGITGHLLSEADVAILDMEAGLEHLGRGTVEHVDTLLVVTEPYYRALEAATRLRDLAVQLGVPRILIVANRLRGAQDREGVESYCDRHNLNLVARIPYDEAIPEAERAGQAPLDYAPQCPALQAICRLLPVLALQPEGSSP